MQVRTIAAGAVVTLAAAGWWAGQAALADTASVRPSSPPEVQGSPAQQRAEMAQAARGSSEASRAGWKQLRGEVERVKRVALRGAEGEHLVALVTGGAGRRMIVDLGPPQQYRNIPITGGDQIAVRGPIGWISDRKVLMAQRVHVNGQTVRVARDRAIDARQLERRPGEANDAPVTGEIQQAHALRLHGVDTRHMVVRLKTEDGRQILADLGTPADLSGVALDQGRSITVQGPTIRVSGKPLILAHHLTAEGKRVEIDREVRSVMPAMLPGVERPGEPGRQAARQQPISGDILVRGEVFKTDADGFYVVRDEAGRETYLIVPPEVQSKNLKVGDRITAHVKPDGTVTSLDNVASDATSPAMSQAR